MPHIIIKMYPGRPEDTKKQLAQKLAQETIKTINCDPKHISVDIQEVEKEDWQDKVYKKEIENKKGSLYVEPGY